MTTPGRFPFVSVIIMTVISFLFVHEVCAEEGKVKVYTLAESISEALENNWGIKAQEEKIQESEFVKKQARADFLPTFSTTYGYTRLNEVQRTEEQTFGPGIVIAGRELNSKNNYQWKGTISQPLFTGFALKSSYELAKLGIDLSKVNLELEKLDMALTVKDAYFNILGADKSVLVARSAVESLKSHLKVARNFYEVGMIPINDLLKAEVELAIAQHDLIIAQNAARLARVAFNTYLSRPVGAEVEVEDILEYEPVSPDLDRYLERALKNRPELQALDINSIQIDQQVILAKSRYYPEVALNYSYIKEGDSSDVSGSPFHDASSWQATLGLSWTLWNWGKTFYSIRENESRKKQLMQTRRTLEDNIELELRKAILNLEEAAKNIPTTKKAVEQAEENLRVSEERYKAQVTTSTEVLDAQTLLSQARLNYYSALYGHKLAKAALLRAIGEY